jgi:hypothetical protein
VLAPVVTERKVAYPVPGVYVAEVPSLPMIPQISSVLDVVTEPVADGAL